MNSINRNNLVSPNKNSNPEIKSEIIKKHFHGGQLNSIAQQYNIPVSEWLDLSTGINQNSYPIPNIPESVWNRLPESNDELDKVATEYFGCDTLLAVSGTQVAIQLLPSIFQTSTVGLIQPSYYEHNKHWSLHKHTVIEFTQNFQNQSIQDSKINLINQINEQIHLLDVLVIINPNNPSGLSFSSKQLHQWHKILHKNNAHLIIDEAFMDAHELTNKTSSMLSPTLLPNLVILRSIGKFFGLAGIRLGFVFANDRILNKIAALQGPWPISGASRWVAIKALADRQWQKQTRLYLQNQSYRLKKLLSDYNLQPNGGTALFQWVLTEDAEKIYDQLNQQGILSRLFDEPKSLRFGLPKNEVQWQKLDNALQVIFCT